MSRLIYANSESRDEQLAENTLTHFRKQMFSERSIGHESAVMRDSVP